MIPDRKKYWVRISLGIFTIALVFSVYKFSIDFIYPQRERAQSSFSGIKEMGVKEFPSPVKGKVILNIGKYYSERFGKEIKHFGNDYLEPEGTVIRATHGGKVIYAGSDSLLGQKIVLDCGEGWKTVYGGLENLRVQKGDVINTQDELGQIGFDSGIEGLDGQTHLHYELWYKGSVLEPMTLK